MMKFQNWTVFLVAIILSTANAFQKSPLILSAKWGTFDFPGGYGLEWSSSFSVTCTVSGDGLPVSLCQLFFG